MALHVAFLLLLSVQSSVQTDGVQDAGGGQEPDWGNQHPVKDLLKQSRKKRAYISDLIDVGRFNPKYKIEEFYGVRSETIVTISNLGSYPDQERGLSYGVRLLPKVVLTLCSVVTYVDNPKMRVHAWDHVLTRYPVKKCDTNVMFVYMMEIAGNVVSIAEVASTETTKVAEILIHPLCDNQYDMDMAVIVLAEPLKEGKDVWIHTAENIMFRRNLDKVVAAQAVLGKCTVPIYKLKYLDIKENPKTVVAFQPVNFQHFYGCTPNVCPYWDRFKLQVRRHERCVNLMNGTKYCLSWPLPDSLCGLAPGTPVFCDVGDVHGLMGFLVNETLICEDSFKTNTVMEALNDGIDWIRNTLAIRNAENYEESVPKWMKNLRLDYVDVHEPRIILKKHETTPIPDVEFKHFVGHQSLSIVLVYENNKIICRGTLVTFQIVVIPCSCVGRFRPEYNEENIKNVKKNSFEIAATDTLEVGLMVNDSQPRAKVLFTELSPKCDSHYMYDHALLLVPGVAKAKVAWLMTSHEVALANMLRVMAIADAAMGHDCYWIHRTGDTENDFFKIKIRFVHWTRCFYNICPGGLWPKFRPDRCFGPPANVESLDTVFCFESTNPEDPACAIPTGTPIFCNVEEARGFVGYVSKAMDVNHVPCLSRPSYNRTGIFVGIDKFLPRFKEYTWIYKMEKDLRDKDELYRHRSSSPTISAYSVLLLMIISFMYFI